MNKTDLTLKYYNENAKKFSAGTSDAGMEQLQTEFLSYIPEGGTILDLGCGSGRDTKYFLNAGYDVTAIDGSEELCKIASKYTGITVKHMYFQELEEKESYDGIWACSSILHLPKDELKKVLVKIADATIKGGIIYTSFKYGDFEGERNGRYFTDFTIESFTDYIKDIDELSIKEYCYCNY